MSHFDMDEMTHHRQLFCKVDRSVSHFLDTVSAIRCESDHFQQQRHLAERELTQLCQSAREIGGMLLHDTEALYAQFLSFARHPDASVLQQMMQDALRIKHEVREL